MWTLQPGKLIIAENLVRMFSENSVIISEWMHAYVAEYLNCQLIYYNLGGFTGLIMELIPLRELQWMETHGWSCIIQI